MSNHPHWSAIERLRMGGWHDAADVLERAHPSLVSEIYWEQRWRDTKQDNDKLRADIEHLQSATGFLRFDFLDMHGLWFWQS